MSFFAVKFFHRKIFVDSLLASSEILHKSVEVCFDITYFYKKKCYWKHHFQKSLKLNCERYMTLGCKGDQPNLNLHLHEFLSGTKWNSNFVILWPQFVVYIQTITFVKCCLREKCEGSFWVFAFIANWIFQTYSTISKCKSSQ